jgi:hypothetical protein
LEFSHVTHNFLISLEVGVPHQHFQGHFSGDLG